MKSIIALLSLCFSLQLLADQQDWKVNVTIGDTAATVSFGSDWHTRSTSDNSGLVTYVANYSDGTRRFVVANPEFFEHGLIDYCGLVGGVTPEHDGTIACWAYAYLRGIGASEPVESVKVLPTGRSDVLRSIQRAKGVQRDIKLYLVNGGAFVLETETRTPKQDAFINTYFNSLSVKKASTATSPR